MSEMLMPPKALCVLSTAAIALAAQDVATLELSLEDICSLLRQDPPTVDFDNESQCSNLVGLLMATLDAFGAAGR